MVQGAKLIMAVDLRKIVLMGNLPEGWSGTPQELLEQFALLARVLFSEEGGTAGSIQFGGTEPASDQDVIWIDRSDSARPQLKIYNSSRAEYATPYSSPIGSVVFFPGSSTDHLDYIECDNRLLTVANEPELYAAIGTLWGGETGVNFRTPDMRGRIPMGANGSTEGAGVDWAGDKGRLLERQMGSTGPAADGNDQTEGADSAGNHLGYPGHDFIFKTPSSSDRPKRPKGQYINLDPATGGNIVSGVQASTVGRFFIKAR